MSVQRERTCLVFIAVVCTVIAGTQQKSTPSSTSYVAAVVEYAAFQDSQTNRPSDVILRNGQEYVNFIQKAEEQGADIIVFPECGLAGMGLPASRDKLRGFATRVPDPLQRVIPCTSTDPHVPQILRNMSCAARNSELYVVINLPEDAPCNRAEDDKCPSDGGYIYNTNVVFDRNGEIISRYRKFNLFIEPGFDITPTAELVSFNTDFGVSFAMFICFDILYLDPAIRAVQELGLVDVIFSTAWFSEMPHLTSTEVQAGWANAMGVNLLASDFNNPERGNSGSGIYAGVSGALSLEMPLTKTSKLLVSRVTKKQFRRPKEIPFTCLHEDNYDSVLTAPRILGEVPASHIGGLRLMQEDLTNFTTVSLEAGDKLVNISKQLCHGDFCCNFNIAMQKTLPSADANNSEYHYRIGVFNGVRDFAVSSVAGIQVCGLFACADRHINSCGRTLNVTDTAAFTTVFKSVTITGSKFLECRTLQMPATLMHPVLPLPGNAYHFSASTINDDPVVYNHIRLQSEKTLNNLLAFSIYGRVFGRDSPIQPRQ